MDMINEIYIVKKKKSLTQKQQESFYRKCIELSRDEETETPKKGHRIMGS